MTGVGGKRFNAVGDVVIGILGVAAFSCGTAFGIVCAKRGIYSLAGWTYHFEAISQYLHLTAARNRILSWDKSWLLAAVAAACALLASWTSDLRQWANKSPDQRRAETQAERDRLAAENASKREQAAMRNKNRKPMSGWRRLWIALSVVFGLGAFALAWNANANVLADISYDGNDAAFWERARADAQLQACDPLTMRTVFRGTNGWYVSCETKDPFTPALLWSIVPALIMALIGLVVRWIYRGFRRAEITKATE